jgi:iron complex transport system substrate-binding protein
MKYVYINIILLFITGLFLTAGTPLSAKTVVDQLGRKVSLPDDPQRIVSLAPSITEIIFALGRENCLKGVTRFSDFPPEAAKLPKVGSYVRLDLEKIVALRPDLCFAIKDGNPREIAARLESLGIPVYAVDPRNLESVMETFLEIGGVLNATQNATEEAKDIVGNMSSRITRVKSLVANAPGRPRVFFQIGLSPIVSVGTRTFIHELIVLAGGKNLSEGPVQYPRFSREQVLALSPEVFIITSMARGASFERVKMEWSKWPDLPAVRNDRILLVDSNLFDRPSPRLVDGLELLLKLIHPELFKGKQ